MTEHISCQGIAEYEFLLAFSPSLEAEQAALYELFSSSVDYSKPWYVAYILIHSVKRVLLRETMLDIMRIAFVYLVF